MKHHDRPFWKRVLFGLVGGIMVLIGLTALLIPLMPTSPFLILGVPMLLCAHPKLEAWGRKKLELWRARYRALRQRWHDRRAARRQ